MSVQPQEPSASPAQEALLRRRFVILVGLFLVIVLGATVALVVFTRHTEEQSMKVDTIPLSQEERIGAEGVAREFVTRAGTWGLREDSVNSSNIVQASSVIANHTPATPSYWASRQDVYRQLKENLLLAVSPLTYGEEVYREWQDDVAETTLSSFKVTSVQAQAQEAGTLTVVGGAQLTTVEVRVTFTSLQKRRIKTADDSSWDGTFRVDEKLITEETVVKVVQETEDAWKVSSMSALKNPYILATWRNAADDYTNTQEGFTPRGTLKGKS